VLHTVDMNDGRGIYSFLSDAKIRKGFYDDLNLLLQQWDYKVIACVVKKAELVKLHGANARDPYQYSLHILVERFCKELGDNLDAGFICAEKRGGSQDHELLREWEKIRTRGTTYASAKSIDCRIVSLDLRDKKPNLAGMQLADLVVTPVGRHVHGTPAKPNQVQWSVVESKLRRVGRTYKGTGLIIRP
jgi:hypothetical protein